MSARTLLVSAGTSAFFLAQDLLTVRHHAAVRSAWLELRELARARPPHRTSFEAVWRARGHGLGAEALTFGDTPVSLAVSLLRAAGVGPGDVVVDPLAGRGRVLLAARLLGAEARGIELDRAHVHVAAPILARAGVTLEQGDARTTDLGALGATCVYLAWTCLPDSARFRVARRIPPGARVVAMTWEPPGTVEKRERRMFPWGRVDVAWSRTDPAETPS